MKSKLSISVGIAFLLTALNICLADELTSESILGKWMFTHIVMDGTQEIKVNNLTEFLPDGSAVFYLAPGVERGRGTYEVTGNSIVYTDDKGEQVWKLVSLEVGNLHVDHRGAEMFFERQ